MFFLSGFMFVNLTARSLICALPVVGLSAGGDFWNRLHFKGSMRFFSSILAFREPPGTCRDFVHTRKWYGAQFNPTTTNLSYTAKTEREKGVGWGDPIVMGSIHPSVRQLVHGFCGFFLSTVGAIATTSSVVRKWKKGLPPWYITVDYEQKVFFVDDHLCFAIIFRVVGQSYALGVHSFFFLGGWAPFNDNMSIINRACC